MGSIKGITTFLFLVAAFIAIWFVAVATLDPLLSVILDFNLGGMGNQVSEIHVAIVKYAVPVFIGAALLWAVFYILREERQTAR